MLKKVSITLLAAFCLIFGTSCELISPRIPTQKIGYDVTYSGLNAATDPSTTVTNFSSVEISAVSPNEANYLAAFGIIDAASTKGVSFKIENGTTLSVALREANSSETLASGKQYTLPSSSSTPILAAFKARVDVPGVGQADVFVNGALPNVSGSIAISEYTPPSAGKTGRITGTIMLMLAKPTITLVSSGQQQLSPRDIKITTTFTCAMKAL